MISPRRSSPPPMKKSICLSRNRWPRTLSTRGTRAGTWSMCAPRVSSNCTIVSQPSFAAPNRRTSHTRSERVSVESECWPAHFVLSRPPVSLARPCIVASMKPIALALLLFAPLAFAQSFSVRFPSSISTHPLDGRLLLLLSNDPSDEPRNQIDDTPRTQMVFGVTVDGWQPDHAQVVDASAWGYPIR